MSLDASGGNGGTQGGTPIVETKPHVEPEQASPQQSDIGGKRFFRTDDKS